MIELYKFTDGTTIYRYTSGDRDISWDGQTWTAIEIRRSRFVSELEPEKQRIDISTHRANAVAMLHLQSPPDMPVDVQVYRGTGSAFTLAWTGVISGVQWSGAEATMQCESPIVLEDRLALRQRYQVMCRHALYSEGCQINPDDFKTTGTVTAINEDGLVIFADLFSTEASAYWRGGHIKARGQTRLISAHNSDTAPLGNIRVTRRIEGLAVSDSIEVFAGCSHDFNTCRTKFDNLINYGGFPSIPRVNPVGRNVNEGTD